MRGHHIYVKDGVVLAGSVPAASGGAKKATKTQVQEHQTHVDAEAKKAKKGAAKSGKTGAASKVSRGGTAGNSSSGRRGSGSLPKDDGKAPSSRKGVPSADNGTPNNGNTTTTGGRSKAGPSKSSTASGGGRGKAKAGEPTLTVPAAGGKTVRGSAKPATTSEAPAESKTPKSTKTTPAKKAGKKAPEVADVRSEAQKNRELAYDVGDKVGGARKDKFIASFREAPTPQNLTALEEDSPETAQKMCVKAIVIGKVDFESEHKNGTDINAAMLKQLIYDRIAPKPKGDTPEDRMAYLSGVYELHRMLTPIKSWDEMKKAISEMSNIARAGAGLAAAETSLANAGKNGNTYTNVEYYEAARDKGKQAKSVLDFEALGDKLNNFFTDYKARNRTIDTLNAKKLSWATYFKPSEVEDEGKGMPRKGATKKRWERLANSEHQRKGGRETKVQKPEDMVKQFGMKGVEFGHYVDDTSGLYHLKRSAEAFHDLADILGIDDKDVSLNGRLSMAFGARGNGTAAAHYEPERKVINMTKHGGAGSLAHEWGHALDNIMYQYSNGGRGSINLASESNMGDTDPTLKDLYKDLMETVYKPVPGEQGGVQKVTIDSTIKPASGYYPQMRREAEGGASAETLYTTWKAKIDRTYDSSLAIAHRNMFNQSEQAIEKQLLKAKRKRTTELNALPHMVAYEMARVTKAEFKQSIEVPTGQSEYYSRMQEMDGSGKPYYAQGAEMFARVFESYIEDKLSAKKRMNNYLVWDTKTTRGSDAPFPVDNERKRMHAAMEALVSHISKGKALKKALSMELQKSIGDISLTEIRNKERTGRYDGKVQTVLSTLWKDNVAAALQSGDNLRISDALHGVKRSEAEYAERLDLRNAAQSGVTERSAYIIDHETDPSEVIYIPVNRLKMVYQTDEATNWDKVKENMDKMRGGTGLKPVEIGYDYDVHDGHHRWIASKGLDYTHVPCIVKGKDEAARIGAINGYRELWKSIVPDPSGTSPFGDGSVMYRGIGQKEMDFINANGFVQSKGKGNDDDKEVRETCFSNLFEQALGYAVSNYTLYNEEAAYVIALPKPPFIEEDEHGELVSRSPVPFGIGVVVPVPNPEDERQVFGDGETVEEAKL